MKDIKITVPEDQIDHFKELIDWINVEIDKSKVDPPEPSNDN